MEVWARRLGSWLIGTSLVLRLAGSCMDGKLTNWMQNGEVQSFLLYLETGRKVRFSPSLAGNTNFVGESHPPVALLAPAEPVPVFSESDTQWTPLTNMSSRSPDLESLLTRPLAWDLQSGEPTVLILHSHATESYTQAGETYRESGAFRTLEPDYNMLSVGDQLAEVLSRKGIAVIHDRELHDYPDYNDAYSQSRQSMAFYLERYPGIRLVLDLHRDASADLQNQIRPLANISGRDTAQLMLVVGTDGSGLSHPGWQENLSLALKLQVQLERLAPGITRPINLRSQRFNQDLSPGALLVEVGAAGNSRAEALRAAEILGEAIASLAGGAGK